MTIEKAIEILNANQHNSYTDWEHDEDNVCIRSAERGPLSFLTEWEAVAIAEKYERLAQKKSNLQRIRDNLSAAQKRKIAERVEELVLEELARRALEEE